MGRGDHLGEGLTPDPYKLVTITSGFAGYNIWLFVLCSIVARGGRFFVVAVLLNRYGDVIRAELEKRLGLWVGIGTAVLVLGFYVAYRWCKCFAGRWLRVTLKPCLIDPATRLRRLGHAPLHPRPC